MTIDASDLRFESRALGDMYDESIEYRGVYKVEGIRK
jgi:hypothetical protein